MSILLRKYTHTYSHKHTLLRHIGLTLYAKRATIIHKVIEVFFLVIFEGQSSGNVTGYKKIMREESHKNNKKTNRMEFPKIRCMGIYQSSKDE